MMIVTEGSTDVTTYFHLRLAADGTDATGLTISNVDMQYTRSGVAPTAKVDAVALAATDSAHTDNRGIEIDATDQPGLYRFDWPDAAFAAGVREVLLTIKVATAFTETLRVQLVSATRGLAGTALPNAAADAAGGLIISDAGGLDADAQRSDVAAILVDTGTTLQGELDGIQADTEDIQTRLPAALVSGRIDASVGAMAANVMTAAAAAADLTTELQSGLATSSALATAQADLDILTGADGAVIASGTQTFNMTGSITGNLSGSVGSVTGAVGSVTGAVGSVTGNVGGSIGSLGAQAKLDVNAEADTALSDVGVTTTVTGRIDTTVSSRATPAQILTTALTEAYRANGAEGTLAQILYELLSAMTEFSISGTTKTNKKIDRSTTATTHTLNDATNPTAVTRAT